MQKVEECLQHAAEAQALEKMAKTWEQLAEGRRREINRWANDPQ
jgi:hypothetical protein